MFNSMRELRGLMQVSLLTMRRQLFARKTIVAIVLVSLMALVAVTWTVRWSQRYEGNEPKRMESFGSLLIMGPFVTFLLPILCLTYATAAIGEEREERTLVYLLTRPLARWRTYLAKGLGVTPVVVLIVAAAFVLTCLAGGTAGLPLVPSFLPGIVIGALAYTSLFLFIGAVFPKPLVVSIVYALLIETMVGNMPGTLKRISISFHTQCLLYSAGESIEMTPRNPERFVALPADTSELVLWYLAGSLAVIGAFLFHRREYRDLA
jgi:ABC-type transport system involved in multi-copper enzyme maturation permease subunit